MQPVTTPSFSPLPNPIITFAFATLFLRFLYSPLLARPQMACLANANDGGAELANSPPLSLALGQTSSFKLGVLNFPSKVPFLFGAADII